MQKEQLVARENARQKELEEVAKKRQQELEAKLEKAGVRPLERERKLDVLLDKWEFYNISFSSDFGT